MNTQTALLLYFVILILITVSLNVLGFNLIPSFLLATVSCFVLLLLLRPPNDVDPWRESESNNAMYTTIIAGTPIPLMIYGLVKALRDLRL